MKTFKWVKVLGLGLLLVPFYSMGQITTPPSGDNQKASVTQYMGFAAVTISYSSPDVHTSAGEDRTGEIWGELVPYGKKNLYFGWSSDENPSPWRAGANEATTISFSEDVLIESVPVKAGSYGLFMVPGEKEWQIILSANSTSWGSYFYSQEEDVASFTVVPKESIFHEYLTYEFEDRKLESCKAIMRWENLSVEFTVAIPDFKTLYVEKIEDELRSKAGFNWENWVEGVNFCLNYNTHLEDALKWSTFALEGKYVGEENFTTLQTKGLVLLALNRNTEAKEYIIKAVNHPTASAGKVHQFGRGLIKKGQPELALEVFKMNYKNHKGEWPTNVGMARGYSAMGQYSSATKYVKKALKIVPDEENKINLEKALDLLEKEKDIN